MSCDEARELLWPPEAPRLAEGRVLDARRHVESCASCRDYLAQDVRLLEALRGARQIQAPVAVRERVFDALARERAGSGPERSSSRERGHGNTGRLGLWPRGIIASAAVLVVTLFMIGDRYFDSGGGVQESDSAMSDVSSAFVEDFLRRAVQAEHIETSDPLEVAQFLARELGTPFGSPVDFPEFDLEGAEVCIVEGLRGAVVIYKQNGRALYHYLIPRTGGAETDPELSSAVPPDWSGEASYPSVVTWRTQDLDQALVSDLPPEELMEVAKALVVGS